MIKELSIYGFRGFGERQSVQFALPNGEIGSGLTIITGANNSGKTTILESIRAFNGGKESPSFSEGRRNKKTGEHIELVIKDENEKKYSIKTVAHGGSSTTKEGEIPSPFYIVQSRRSIPYEFSHTQWNKKTYMQAAQKLENQRNSFLTNFEARLFQIEEKKVDFDKLLTQVLGQDFDWTIELSNSGNYYIKCKCQNMTHSSEGMGDGIWSIFTICAALFDSETGNVIVIDEPELSIHPALQKKLMRLLLSYSRRMQIIISTHSPYFIDWEAITNGAQLMRVVKEGANSKCYSITENTRTAFKNLMRDINNPHVLGIEANEALFLGDNIILVEGQEDVVILNKICKDLKLELNGDFYGWGVGGAPKMGTFLLLFQELGYKHVVAILDGDKKEDSERLKIKFQRYKIITLKTDDIRDKEEKKIKSKEGITTAKGEIKPEYVEYAKSLISEINNSFQL